MLMRRIITSVLISSLIVMVMVYIEQHFIRGVLSYIGMILSAPGFFIMLLFKVVFQRGGEWEAIHNISFESLSFVLISFIFYSFLITLIQMIFIKLRK
jgi:hypothetical protein